MSLLEAPAITKGTVDSARDFAPVQEPGPAKIQMLAVGPPYLIGARCTVREVHGALPVDVSKLPTRLPTFPLFSSFNQSRQHLRTPTPNHIDPRNARMGPTSTRSLSRSLETHPKYSQKPILSRYTVKTRWPERRRQLFPPSLSSLFPSTTPPPQFSDSGFLVRECPSWPLGCSVLPQYVAASSPVSGAFSSLAAHGITAGFRGFSPPFRHSE